MSASNQFHQASWTGEKDWDRMEGRTETRGQLFCSRVTQLLSWTPIISGGDRRPKYNSSHGVINRKFLWPGKAQEPRCRVGKTASTRRKRISCGMPQRRFAFASFFFGPSCFCLAIPWELCCRFTLPSLRCAVFSSFISSGRTASTFRPLAKEDGAQWLSVASKPGGIFGTISRCVWCGHGVWTSRKTTFSAITHMG